MVTYPVPSAIGIVATFPCEESGIPSPFPSPPLGPASSMVPVTPSPSSQPVAIALFVTAATAPVVYAAATTKPS